MQRLCRFAGDVNEYLGDPDVLVEEATLRCTFCKEPHRLRRHGWYRRWVVLPPEFGEVEIPVRRLFCAAVKRTVSLLPDFCIPRRQHSAAVLAKFLEGLVKGNALGEALATARGGTSSHSQAQALLGGFLARRAEISAYLGRLRPRALMLRDSPFPGRRTLTWLLESLTASFRHAEAAFRHHAIRLYEEFESALA